MRQAPVLICALLIAAACQPEEPELPKERSAFPILRTESVTITVAADGSILWNGVKIDEAEFNQRLAIESQKNPKPEIIIAPDRDTKYPAVSAVITALQRAGLTDRAGVIGGT